MDSVKAFLARSARPIGLFGLLAIFVRALSPAPPPRTLEGLAAMLGRAVDGAVEPGEIVWEPSPGFLAETFIGRRALFLARTKPGAPRDLYRARVRVTLQGQPIDVRDVRNITDTPAGDDVGLEASAGNATFATLAFGKIQGISVLELPGMRSGDRPPNWFDRLLTALSAFQATGSFAGLGRTDIVLDVPAEHAQIKLGPGVLEVDFGQEGRSLHYDIERRALRGLEGGQAYAARAIPQVHGEKPLLLWLVDTVRAEVGPGPVAWLENKVFGARDSVKRTVYNVLSPASERALGGEQQKTVVAKVLDADGLESADATWPPPPIPSLWQKTQQGEGEWKPVTYPFLKPMLRLAPDSAAPPAYFYRTFIRPDPERPYSKLLLIAMDMRQLELGMQAGWEDPKPTTGPPGEGRLPSNPEVTSRVVATFNGAFKTTHGAYGMMVDRRVLLPPVAGGATVIVNTAGEVGLGSWPQSDEIPADIVSFRQNLDPLVEDGVANPTGRHIWGWQLEGQSVLTQRSALCVTSAGHLYYAWGEELDGKTLGQGLRRAGCSYGIHLDMNPQHTGFVFSDILDLKEGKFQLRLADPGMKIRPDKFVRWSTKDFFYVMVRDPLPRDASSLRWTPDGGAQPPPAWLPGVFSGTLTIGSLDVELLSFEKGHVAWRVRAGSKEPGMWGARGARLSLDEADARRALAAIGLGHTTEATRLGIAFGAVAPLPLRSQNALLIAGEGGLRIEAAGSAKPEPNEDAVELPLLAEGTRIEPRARERGELRLRAALCVTPTGRVVVAQARHDSADPLVAALLRLDCERIVELDRGSRHPAFVHRAGTPVPPINGYETSVLYALGRPLQPRAFRWKPSGSSPSTKPTSYDFPVASGP
jgi:hypothetical protein